MLIQIPETGLGLLGHGRMLYVGMYFGVIQEDIIPIHCFAGTSVSNKFIKLNINQMCYSSVIRCLFWILGPGVGKIIIKK